MNGCVCSTLSIKARRPTAHTNPLKGARRLAAALIAVDSDRGDDERPSTGSRLAAYWPVAHSAAQTDRRNDYR